jgi:predicted lactoylglutathione lyase
LRRHDDAKSASRHNRHQLGLECNRDLAQDLAAIRAWGAAAIVTLIEDHEFDLLSLQGLPETG